MTIEKFGPVPKPAYSTISLKPLTGGSFYNAGKQKMYLTLVEFQSTNQGGSAKREGVEEMPVPHFHILCGSYSLIRAVLQSGLIQIDLENSLTSMSRPISSKE